MQLVHLVPSGCKRFTTENGMVGWMGRTSLHGSFGPLLHFPCWTFFRHPVQKTSFQLIKADKLINQCNHAHPAARLGPSSGTWRWRPPSPPRPSLPERRPGRGSRAARTSGAPCPTRPACTWRSRWEARAPSRPANSGNLNLALL